MMRLAVLPGWVLGVALQLQQPALWSPPVYGLLLCAGLLLLLGGGRLRAGAGVVVVLSGSLIGFGLTGARATHFANHALDPALQGIDIELTGRIASLPQRMAQGERFEFVVQAATYNGIAVRVPERVQLGWYSGFAAAAEEPLWELARRGPALRAGDRWRFTVRLRAPHGLSNPHGFDREGWLWERGIQATGHVKTGPRDPAPQRLDASPWPSLDALRQDVSDRIDERVADPAAAGVLSALVVGDQSAIEHDDWALFRTTGVAHLMSISGLHVTMFAWLATAWLAWGWRRLAPVWPQALLALPTPVVAGVGGVLLATAYALFAGWGVPAQRTLIMLAVVVGLRLGCLNHALLSAEAIRADGLQLAGWVANGIDPDMACRDDNIDTLRRWLPAPLLGTVPFCVGTPDARQIALKLPAAWQCRRRDELVE